MMFEPSQLDVSHRASKYLYIQKQYDYILPILGFLANPVLYPESHHQDQDLPVFVTTVHSKDLHSFHKFLSSFRLYFPQKKLLVYNLGLSDYEFTLVSEFI